MTICFWFLCCIHILGFWLPLHNWVAIGSWWLSPAPHSIFFLYLESCRKDLLYLEISRGTKEWPPLLEVGRAFTKGERASLGSWRVSWSPPGNSEGEVLSGGGNLRAGSWSCEAAWGRSVWPEESTGSGHCALGTWYWAVIYWTTTVCKWWVLGDTGTRSVSAIKGFRSKSRQRSLDKDPHDAADFGVKQHNNSSKSLGLRFQNRGRKTFIWKKASWRG